MLPDMNNRDVNIESVAEKALADRGPLSEILWRGLHQRKRLRIIIGLYLGATGNITTDDNR